MSPNATATPTSEVRILARVLGKEDGQLPPAMARYILTLTFTDQEKARMHDLAVRNQSDALSAEEREELHAYGKAGSLLSILKSRSRRVLKVQSRKRRPS